MKGASHLRHLRQFPHRRPPSLSRPSQTQFRSHRLQPLRRMRGLDSSSFLPPDPVGRRYQTPATLSEHRGVQLLWKQLLTGDSIIAVHGLGGHWRTTWAGDDGAIWLKDRLPDLLGEANIVARIRSFGYDSATVFSRSVGDLPTAGKSLLMRLRGFRKTPQERDSPLIFVCHSLGGLVVKEVIRRLTPNFTFDMMLMTELIGLGLCMESLVPQPRHSGEG